MKRFFVSAGLVAVGAAVMESAMADDSTGPKYWNVGATLRGFYDDNYDITSNQKGSFGLELDPFLSFHVPLQQTDIGLRYTYGLYWYEDRQEIGVNPFDQTHQLDLWLDHAFNERWKSKVTDTFAVGQEPELLTPNPVTGVATPYRVNGDNLSNHGGLSLDTEWTRQFSTSLTYNNGWYDYDNSGAFVDSNGMLVTGNQGGASLEGILGRVEQSVALNLQWHILQDTILSVGYSFSWTDFTANEPIALVPLPAGNFTYYSSDRNYYSHYGFVGLSDDLTPNLSASISVGAAYTDAYADPLFPSTELSPYADISLSYTYVPGSYVQFGFTQNVGASDQVAPNMAGGITQYANDSVVYVDVNHRFTPKLIGTAIGRVQYSTYQGGAASSQDTTDFGLGLNLTYQFNAHLSVDAGYNFDDVTSGIAGYAYTRNRVYLGLTANY